MEVYYGFAFFVFLCLVTGLLAWVEYLRSHRRFLVPASMAVACAAGWHVLNGFTTYQEYPVPLLVASGVVNLVVALLWLQAAGVLSNRPVSAWLHALAFAAYAGLIAAAATNEQSPDPWAAATNAPAALVLLEASRRCFAAPPLRAGLLPGILLLLSAVTLGLFSAQMAVDGPYIGLMYFFLSLLQPFAGVAFAQASVVLQSDALNATVRRLKETEVDLRTSMEEVARRESDYKRLVQNLPDIVLRLDADGRLLYASSRLREAIGKPAEAVMGATVCQAPFPADVQAIWRRTFMRLRETGEAQEFEFSLPGDDGAVQDYRGRALPELEGGSLHSALVIVEDVTESKRFVDALRASEARFREIFESLQDVYCKTALDGEILEVSPSVSQWGYRREDLIGTNALEVYADPSDRERVLARLEAECSVRNELARLKRADGEPITVRWSATYLDGKGDAPRVVGMLRDVTDELRLEQERARLERQFLEAQKMESVGLLAGGVAHDFNNLLQGILGHADLLAEDGATSEKAARHLAVIIEAAEDAAALCRQLLDYSGRGHFMLSPVNLSDIVWDVSELIEVGIPKPIELRIETTSKVPRIEGDSAQLRQIIINLVKNAADSIGDRPGKLTVSTGSERFTQETLGRCLGSETLPEGEYVYLRVTDTGRGLGPELVPRIFDPFFSTKDHGQGLGLAAVIGIVRGHSGGILVESTPHEETGFTLLFPPVDAATPPAPGNGRARAEGAGQLVILADDEPMVLDVCREMIEAQGFEVVTASTGTEAVSAYESHRDREPIVVLDVMMPEMGGIEACRAIRSRAPNARVILASGFADLASRLTPEEAATTSLVPKPYRIAELVGAIDALKRRAPGDTLKLDEQ